MGGEKITWCIGVVGSPVEHSGELIGRKRGGRKGKRALGLGLLVTFEPSPSPSSPTSLLVWHKHVNENAERRRSRERNQARASHVPWHAFALLIRVSLSTCMHFIHKSESSLIFSFSSLGCANLLSKLGERSISQSYVHISVDLRAFCTGLEKKKVAGLGR